MTAELADLLDRTPDGTRVLESLGWLGEAIEEVRAGRARASRQGVR